MLHYHGTPITPRSKLLELAGRCFCVRYGEHRDLEVCHEIGQSVMIDNGAFSLWTNGTPTDWEAYATWVAPWLDYRTTWCVIPDVIDGTEEENNDLIDWWLKNTSFRREQIAPVWHMHESVFRLESLAHFFPRVCIGSSGEYAKIGDARWHWRMIDVMDSLCGNGPSPCWLHMLRGLGLAGGVYPFASADSTSIAQNHAGNNTRMTPAKDVRKMADRIDGQQCAARWHASQPQETLAI